MSPLVWPQTGFYLWLSKRASQCKADSTDAWVPLGHGWTLLKTLGKASLLKTHCWYGFCLVKTLWYQCDHDKFSEGKREKVPIDEPFVEEYMCYIKKESFISAQHCLL